MFTPSTDRRAIPTTRVRAKDEVGGTISVLRRRVGRRSGEAQASASAPISAARRYTTSLARISPDLARRRLASTTLSTTSPIYRDHEAGHASNSDSASAVTPTLEHDKSLRWDDYDAVKTELLTTVGTKCSSSAARSAH
ncbi:hypothetical protein EVAR_9485_1 [Eumeta japonica]|uniref:Uncharacterized protein n=1 Tax=Eumeta variegata TaxID=151549 RepID=A0A4C2A3X6_EUMVA|nr:hypothetical protein EVAR_9485_1 [Eumeta japonica]